MENKYDDIMGKFGYFEIKNHMSVTEEMISAYESELGFKFPADYRTFLQKYGLTALEGYIWYPDPDRPGKPGGGVEAFLGISPDNSGDLLVTRRLLGNRLPLEMLPIADSGGKICISLHGKDSGRVFSWEPERFHADPYRNLDLIAEDFDSFMRSLYVEDEE